MPIYGFAGVECPMEGIIKFPTTIDQEPRQIMQMLDFVVVKASSTYNAIMGRTGIHALKAVHSSYHLVMKFPTRNGIGEERGDQKMARSCYVTSLRADEVGGSFCLLKIWIFERMMRKEGSQQKTWFRFL